MPRYDFITELLELEDIILKDFSFTVTEIHISFALKRKPTVCPCCGFITEQVHDYRPSTIKDLPLMGKQLFLHYNKRRYHCPACNKHFYEPFHLVPKYCRITTRLAFYSLHMLKNRYSVRNAATFLGISDSTIFRRLKDVRYLVTDMNRVYKDLEVQYFPNAAIVIDKFHVVRYATWALENVRKRVQKQKPAAG